MALTNKGSKWERKNSLIFIWSLFPVLSCITFFGMNSRVKNKKWSLLGWLSIILNMILILSLIIPMVLDNPNERPYFYDVEKAPEVIDFMTDEQKKLYYDDYSYENSSDFKITDEYLEYQKAYDDWTDREKEWEKQPEIAAQIDKYESFDSNKEVVMISSFAALFVIHVVFLILSLTDRTKYLKLLEQSENKNSITNRINSVTKNMSESTDDIKRTEIQYNTIKQIDINTANEDELSSLQGMTIVDAKKAVAYRDEHNGFDTVDEFFNCVNAKPHIIVALEKQLIVGEYKTLKPSKTDHPAKRTLDL